MYQRRRLADKKLKNYVSFYNGFTYEGTGDLPTNHAELCVLDASVKDSIFVSKRICGCPTDDTNKYLILVKGNNGIERMCADSSKFGEGGLEM